MPAHASRALALRTTDGLQLRLSEDGSIAGVTIGGRRLPQTGHQGGFSVREVGGNPNLLPNGGFEIDAEHNDIPDGWSFVRGSEGTPVRVSDVSHAGGSSVRIDKVPGANGGYFNTSVPVQPDTNYSLSGWIRTLDVLPTAPTSQAPRSSSPVRLLIKEISSNGVVTTSESEVHGYTNTSEWARHFAAIRTAPDTVRLRITGVFFGGSGTSWFDDISISELFSEEEVEVSGHTTAKARRRLRQQASTGRGIDLTATYTARPNHIRINGTARTTDGRDHALQITYTLPVDATGWNWGEYARSSHVIQPGSSHSYLTDWNIESVSRYPYSTIWDEHSSISIGLPIGKPRLARQEYVAGKGLQITFDLGVSPDSLGGEAPFSLVLFKSDPEWGFRSATAKYYSLSPTAFESHIPARRHGIWFAKPDLSKLDDQQTEEDESNVYGLGLNVVALGKWSDQSHQTWGVNYLPWDNARDILGHAYTHHWVFYHRKEDATIPTYDEEMSRLRHDALLVPSSPAEEQLRDETKATLSSGMRDYNGRYLYESYNNHVSFFENLDSRWRTSVAKYQVQAAIELAADRGLRLDGIHFDSTSGMRRWNAAENYRRTHWRRATIPLNFSYATGEVTQFGVMPNIAHLRQTASSLHDRDLFVSVNFNGSEARAGAWFGTDVIDYFGIEQALQDKTSAATDRFVTLDSFAMFKRTMAYQRPISALDRKVGDGTITLEEADKRLREHLFYGIFLGAAAETLSSGPLTSPEGRAMYAHYTPIFKRLARAGWEPVTNAVSSNPDVWIERFGSRGSSNLLFTLRNSGETEQVYTVEMEVAGRKCPATAVDVLELVNDEAQPAELAPSGRMASTQGSIAPKDTAVLRVDIVPCPSAL